MLAVTTGHFSQAKVIALDTAKNIEGVFQKTSEDMDHIWESQTDKQIAEALKASNGRIAVSVQGAEAMHDKLAEIEAEIQQKMAALGEETFAKKRLMDQAEIAAERAKIEKEFKDEVDKNGRIVKVNQDRQKALDKLGQLAVKQDQERTRQEVKIKTQGALDIVDLSLQTLNILNSMGDNSTKAEVARARVILALEKAIAIGRIWTAASSGNVAVDVGMKIAGTALVVAQFAQQSKAIGEAASRANAGTGSIGAGGSEDAGGPGSGVSGISGAWRGRRARNGGNRRRVRWRGRRRGKRDDRHQRGRRRRPVLRGPRGPLRHRRGRAEAGRIRPQRRRGRRRAGGCHEERRRPQRGPGGVT
jgi:hypothetical protein